MPAPGRTQALLRGVGTWPAPAGVGGSEKPPTGAGQRPHYPQGPPDVLNAFKTVLDQAPGQPHCPSPAHADQLQTGRCQGTTDLLRLTKGFLKHPGHLPSVSKHPRGQKERSLPCLARQVPGRFVTHGGALWPAPGSEGGCEPLKRGRRGGWGRCAPRPHFQLFGGTLFTAYGEA